MPFGHINFQPANKDAESELGDAVAWYGACLWKNGQTGIDYQVGQVGSAWRLSTFLWGKGAHLPKAHADYGRKALAEASALARNKPRWALAKPGRDESEFKHWRGATSLFFRPPGDHDSPCLLRRGNDGLPVPIYSVPVTGNRRENITSALEHQRRLFEIWITSGELEIQAYRALCEVRRQSAERLLEHAAVIELATGLPTYVELFRHYAHRRSADEVNRPCPGCGRPWYRKQPERGGGLSFFDFQCERCRLVQLVGASDNDGERLARIGNWKPGPKIASISVRLKELKSQKVIW